MAEKEATEKGDSPKSWRPDSIFWGGVLVFLGILLLLNTTGAINANMWELWRLWPITLVAVGISIFAPKGIIAKVCNSALLVITIVLAFYVSTTDAVTQQVSGDEQTRSFSRGLIGAQAADVKIDGGAITLNLNSAAMRDVARAALQSEHFTLKTTSDTSDGMQRVTIGLESQGFPWFPTGDNILDVTLGQDLPTDLTIDSGASQINGDLSSVNLRNLTFDAGASSVNLKLGDKQAEQRVNVDGGASSLTLRVPRSSGVQIKMDAGLVNKDFDDIREVSKDTYETDSFETTSRKVFIAVNAGASNLKIERY